MSARGCQVSPTEARRLLATLPLDKLERTRQILLRTDAAANLLGNVLAMLNARTLARAVELRLLGEGEPDSRPARRRSDTILKDRGRSSGQREGWQSGH